MLEYWPQLFYISFTLGGLLFLLFNHGQPRTGRHNFYISLVVTIFVFWLLYKGGFFPL